MGVLVDDLLLLARLDQGRPLELTPLDLDTLVADAVEAARAADPGRPFLFEHAGSLSVHADAGRLRQAVDNLLNNASVHTPEGSPVHVALTRRDGSAVLTVADEGPGLEPGQAARVFDRFSRGEQARARPGTGLGLSIVAALAEAHGGRATASDRVGGGAEFRLELPLSSEAAPTAVGAESPAARKGLSQAAGNGTVGDGPGGTMAGRGRRVGDVVGR
jgi:two-component system OmpR family sensor kinase